VENGQYFTTKTHKTMKKTELIELMKDYPDDAEVVIVDTVNRWSIEKSCLNQKNR
jgi:hypothetical protein